MEFTNAALATSVRSLSASADIHASAIGDNFRIEENVCDARRDDFEALNTHQTDIAKAAESYFKLRVEGLRHGHLPSTFDAAVNNHLMLPASIEPNQKIVRLELIDAVLVEEHWSFDRLERRDPNDLGVILARINQYPGERPAFVAFKSEVEDDLREPDWLARMIDRMGLYHRYGGGPGETISFALMEYTVKDVFERNRQVDVDRPFAIATALECRNNPAFFPVPQGTNHGFTVDLAERNPPRPSPREVLHCRFDYEIGDLARLGQWTTTDRPDLATARARHGDMLRRETGRADFGE